MNSLELAYFSFCVHSSSMSLSLGIGGIWRWISVSSPSRARFYRVLLVGYSNSDGVNSSPPRGGSKPLSNRRAACSSHSSARVPTTTGIRCPAEYSKILPWGFLTWATARSLPLYLTNSNGPKLLGSNFPILIWRIITRSPALKW